ncbi:Bidirectional sugar transporter SWEET15 [Phytophthora citrophthora]|uniref:Sugar transporter SWEET1 n=1 Tax=Phytophthora citrophthora TaxID=4793 RepID=A0AAD9GR24_9STRA|nr:Bidirectional sugar transporter SWEET15 [Phytophthora citrophthora]
MSGYDIAVIVAKVLTIMATILMRISLLPDFQRMRKLQSTGDKSVVPCVILYTHCFVAAFYAYIIDDIVPLFATSVLGMVVGGFLAIFFYRWTEDKPSVLRGVTVSFVACLLVAVYSILALAGVTGQSNDSIGTTLGFVTIGTTTGLYVAPMAIITRVLRTKTSSSMPFTMGVVNVFSTVSSILYSFLVYNIFILAPNSVGFVIGSVQLILTFIYPRKPTIDEEEDRVRLNVLSASHDRKVNEVKEETNSSFLALQSPAMS